MNQAAAAPSSDPSQGRARARAVRLLGGLSLALAAAALAMGGRWLLAEAGSELPFVFAFPAVALLALFAGIAPAVMAALLCAFVWIHPAVSPAGPGGGTWLQAGLFLPSALAIAFVVGLAGPAGHAGQPKARIEPPGAAPSARGWLLALMASAIVVPAVVFVAVAWHGYWAAFDDAQAKLDRAARIAHAHAQQALQTTALLFRGVDLAVADLTDAEIRARSAELAARLARLADGAPGVRNVGVWSASGESLVATESPAPVAGAAEQELLALHASTAGDIHVSRVAARDGAESRFTASRRRAAAADDFAGIVTISLREGYFASFYRQLSRHEHGIAMVLIRDDGVPVARYPALPQMFNGGAGASPVVERFRAGDSHGTLSAVSRFDGRLRLISFRRIEDHPLYVAVSIPHERILAPWRETVSVLAAVTFPISLALVGVSWVAWRRTRREHAALRMLHDEAERRARAEDALRQSQKLEALGHLTGGVAHDVNNLLMVVSNNAHVLKRLPAGTDLGPPIDAILRAVRSGTRLTRQLLAFSRRQALRPETVDLRARLPAMIEMIRHSGGAGVEISGRVEPGTGSIEVDPAELELALINLAVNARDAMSAGGRIEIVARSASPQEFSSGDRDCVAISVSDTGCGIPPEVLDKVWEPFFTTKGPGKGTGLGLSQVYGFCVQSGGIARIRSAPGQGTTVIMYLPRSQRALSPPTEARPGAEAFRILLVEDDDAVAAANAALLESAGHLVVRCPDAGAAAEMLQERAPDFDLVLSDVAMPGPIDGLQLATLVRACHPKLAVLLITGYTDKLDQAFAHDCDVLSKPCPPEVLLATLTRAVVQQRRRRPDALRPAADAAT